MLRRLNQIYLNMSLSHKIMAMVTLLVMIPVLVISMMFYRHMHQSIRQEVNSNYVHVVEQYMSNLRYKLTIYNNFLDTLISNKQFQHVLANQEQYTSEQHIQVNRMFTQGIESGVFLSAPELYGITFYAESPLFPRDGRYISNMNALRGEHWAALLPEMIPSELTVIHYRTLGLKTEVISFIKPIPDLSGSTFYRRLGLVKVDVEAAVFFGTGIEETKLPNVHLLVQNAAGEVLYASNPAEAGVPGERYKEGIHYLSSQNVRVTGELDKSDWSVSIEFPYHEIERKLAEVIRQAIPFILALLVFVTMMTYIMSAVLMKRLRRFIGKMEKVKTGNFVVADIIPGRDEIGLIDNRFNAMVSRLNELVHENYIQGLQKKRAELIALQNQINPHFLFNTLESINSIASIVGAKEISSISQSLGDMLRYSIKINDEFVKLSDEINHIQHYVRIQNVRFDNRFMLSVALDAQLSGAKVMKLMLQPVVENALLHAFKKSKRTGTVKVAVSSDKQRLLIAISDDGVGIEDERLAEIRQRLANHDETESVGLQNVHSRIQLAYGPQFGLSIDSKAGAGTTVSLLLPLVQ